MRTARIRIRVSFCIEVDCTFGIKSLKSGFKGVSDGKRLNISSGLRRRAEARLPEVHIHLWMNEPRTCLRRWGRDVTDHPTRLMLCSVLPLNRTAERCSTKLVPINLDKYILPTKIWIYQTLFFKIVAATWEENWNTICKEAYRRITFAYNNNLRSTIDGVFLITYFM